MADSLRHYFSLLYGSTEQDDSESTDKHTPKDFDEEVDPIGFTDEEDVQNSVPDNKARNYGKTSPLMVDGEPIQCQICRKQFQNQNTLQNHLDMHILYSHNQCAYCCKVFSLKKNLRRHEARIHFIDSGTYRCLTCPKIFPDPDILGNHTMLCRSRKPKCYMCSTELKSFDNLSVHLENEHNLRGYVCGFCATSLPTEEELGMHLMCCKKAPVGQKNKCSKHLKFCKKAPVAKENMCSNIKEASSIRSEIKMSQSESFNAMPKMKGCKRKAGNDLE